MAARAPLRRRPATQRPAPLSHRLRGSSLRARPRRSTRGRRRLRRRSSQAVHPTRRPSWSRRTNRSARCQMRRMSRRNPTSRMRPRRRTVVVRVLTVDPSPKASGRSPRSESSQVRSSDSPSRRPDRPAACSSSRCRSCHRRRVVPTIAVARVVAHELSSPLSRRSCRHSTSRRAAVAVAVSSLDEPSSPLSPPLVSSLGEPCHRCRRRSCHRSTRCRCSAAAYRRPRRARPP